MDTIFMKQSKYKILVDEFANNIRNGKLPPGTQLPTHRKLASEQGIALVSASKVYTQLEKMGLVSGETGRGTFVRETSIPVNHGIDQQPIAEDVIDLNFNSPALPNQTNLLRDALKQLASSGDLATLLHYQPHIGRKHERAIIAKHLQSRALNVSADQIAITSGAQHGLACTVISLLKPGDVVAVDSLIYPGFKLLGDVHCLELVAIPFSENEPDLDALSNLCNQRKVKAVYAMPTLHNPMGWVLDIKWRKQLINIARAHQLLIIEDAAYAFHAKNPPPPLASLAPDLTVYVSGFSKSIATGLRVGFVALPIKWIAKIERTIRATVWNTPALMTTIACKWIEDKTIAKLEREKRNDAKERQKIARRIFKDLDYISHENAYFIWLPLPEEVRSDQIVSQLLKDKISVSTAEPFATTEHVPHALRIALGSVDMAKLEHALRKVKDCIENYAY
jgi:DNA-binding transcriptional MocR family regulator